MTLPNLTSPTAELIAYRSMLCGSIGDLNLKILQMECKREYLREMVTEIADELNRRESCTHPSLTDGTCSGCGLPADQLPFMTTTHWRECPHEDFTENLEGRKCRTCGLETK